MEHVDQNPIQPPHSDLNQPATDQSAPQEHQPGPTPLDRRVLLGVAGLAGFAALAKFAKAGELSPPQGPITPTGVSLTQLDAKVSEAKNTIGAIAHKVAATDQGVSEPRVPIRSLSASPSAMFVITQPGAYCLTDNIDQVSGMVCIDVQCSDVDIDCQGFAFRGSGTASSTPSSCVRSSGQSNIELYDCTFSGWQGCCVDCGDCDDVCVSDCTFRHCTCPPGISADGTVSPGAVIRGRDRCELEELHISACDGHSIQARHGSYACAIEVCDGTGDAIVIGQSGEVEDCLFRNIVGRAIRCADGTCADTCAVHGAIIPQGAAAIECSSHCCVSDCEARDCSGLAFSLGSECVVDCCDVTGGSGGAFRCADGCCLDGCTVLRHISAACIITNVRTRINELEARLCSGGILLSVGADSTVECCEFTGGSGGAIHCDDGCCVEDCSINNHQGIAIQCSSRCTIDSNKVVASWGIECAAECCVSDNEVSYDGSGGGGGGGGGGGINIYGERCCVSGNYVAGVIYLFGGADRCLVEDNHVVGAGGPPGTGGGSISIGAGVTGCSLRSNHSRRGSMTNAFVIPPGNSFGPIVNSIDGGDLSLIQGGSHPHANFVS